MLIKEHKEGEVYTYNGMQYVIQKKVFKVNTITDMEKQLGVELLDSYSRRVLINFWKSNYGKDPNIMYDPTTCKYSLVEIKPGDTVEFVGFEYDYKGYPQFNPIGGYMLYGADLEYNVLVDVKKCTDKIYSLVDLIKDDSLKDCCKDMLDQYCTTMINRPAAHTHHHAYPAGLLQHTAEVMAIAYSIAQNFNDINMDYIITAALFHDIMKIEEYDWNGNVQDYARIIGHVVGSFLLFKELAEKHNVAGLSKKEITHILLSHHGITTYGSPVEPKTMEAIIVHMADTISAKINPIAISTGDELQNDYYFKW